MKNFITFLFIAALIALGFFASRGVSNTPNSTNLSTPTASAIETATPETSPLPTTSSSPLGQGGGAAPSGNIVTVSVTNTASEIQRIDVTTKKKTTLFTDKDLKDKLQLVSAITRDGDTIVAVLGPSDQQPGKLVSIKTDGSGSTTTLIDDFLTTEPVAISPDKTKLAMISFSNADPNYGFSLIVMNVDGSNKKTLLTDPSGISRLSFSPDGKEIAFIKGSADDSNEIAAVAIATSKVRSIYQNKDRVISDFDWNSLDIFSLTLATADKKTTQTEVYLYDPKNKALNQITKNSVPERSPKIAPDASGIAFLQLKTEDATNLKKNGNITVTHADGSQPTVIGTSSQLLGWTR